MITGDETTDPKAGHEQPPRQAQTPPPPIRRIRVDTAPTIAPPKPIEVALRDDAVGGRSRRPMRGPGGPERMTVDRLSVFYGSKQAVKHVSLPIRQGEVLALIGPSGCGK